MEEDGTSTWFTPHKRRRENSRKGVCPVCYHKEEMQARAANCTPCHDDTPMMEFRRLHGPRGLPLTTDGFGWWECRSCGFHEKANNAGILLDAVLHLSVPDCDSIGEDTIHADTLIVLQGDGRQSFRESRDQEDDPSPPT